MSQNLFMEQKKRCTSIMKRFRSLFGNSAIAKRHIVFIHMAASGIVNFCHFNFPMGLCLNTIALAQRKEATELKQYLIFFRSIE